MCQGSQLRTGSPAPLCLFSQIHLLTSSMGFRLQYSEEIPSSDGLRIVLTLGCREGCLVSTVQKHIKYATQDSLEAARQLTCSYQTTQPEAALKWLRESQCARARFAHSGSGRYLRFKVDASASPTPGAIVRCFERRQTRFARRLDRTGRRSDRWSCAW